MKIRPVLTAMFASLLTVDWDAYCLAQVTTKYDAFKNKTTITVMGEQVNEKPVLYIWDSFDGRQPAPHYRIGSGARRIASPHSVEFGFLVKGGCGHPNVVADGQRIQPSSGDESGSGVSSEDVRTSAGIESYLFVFTFYDLPQVAQIAKAKSVQYQICNRVFTLSSGDQAQLRELITHYQSINR